MWIDGGIHAREWISPAVATYHMRELVENGDKYPSEIVDQVDWYILPVHNPDGYEYSRVRDRFWRKSRYGCETHHQTSVINMNQETKCETFLYEFINIWDKIGNIGSTANK